MKELYSKLNFFVASLVSILGFTMIYEIISEDDISDKIDDILMFVLGLVAIWWYKKSGYKGQSSKLALFVTIGASLIKIMAIVIEHADKEAVGDDIGILMSLLLALMFVGYLVVFRQKKA